METRLWLVHRGPVKQSSAFTPPLRSDQVSSLHSLFVTRPISTLAHPASLWTCHRHTRARPVMPRLQRELSLRGFCPWRIVRAHAESPVAFWCWVQESSAEPWRLSADVVAPPGPWSPSYQPSSRIAARREGHSSGPPAGRKSSSEAARGLSDQCLPVEPRKHVVPQTHLPRGHPKVFQCSFDGTSAVDGGLSPSEVAAN